ncbi:hypothetical protein [Paraburkholderia antibiotica]|nr:hypothetical protein [Paraburkholderia antibiotica]
MKIIYRAEDGKEFGGKQDCAKGERVQDRLPRGASVRWRRRQ